MKNIFKKIVGALLATSMIFTISFASVYADEEYYDYEENERFFIDDSQSSNYGITATVENENLRYIESSKVSESEGFVGFTSDSVYEIYDLKMVYSTGKDEKGEDILATTTESEICGEMVIELPCENTDLNVILVTSDGPYQIDAEADSEAGCLIFGISRLGKIILTSDHMYYYDELEREGGIKFSEQTVVDEKTKMQVSGKLPEGSTMYTKLHNVNLFNLTEEDRTSKQIIDDFKRPLMSDVYTIDSSTQTTPYNMDWMKSDPTASGLLYVNVEFEKRLEFIDVDTPITVTIPFDYREFLKYSQTGTDLEAYQLNHRTGNMVPVEILPAQNGTLQFKANSSGSFFVGNKAMIEDFVKVYGYEYEDFNINNTAIQSEQTKETPDSDINIALIICIATNIIWLVVVVLIVKNKKKNSALKADSSK